MLFTRRRREALAAAGIVPPTRRTRAFGPWFTLVGIAVLALAMAGPLASLPVGRSSGTVIVAMDVSNSMGATDVSPTRLAAAQQAAVAFINAQPDNVDVGVVGFDQGALTTSLPSADKSPAVAAVQNLRVSGGTSLSAAILGSLTAITGKTVSIGKDGSNSRSRVLGFGNDRDVLRRGGPGPGGQRRTRGHRGAERRRAHRHRRGGHGGRHQRRGGRVPGAHGAERRRADHDRADRRRRTITRRRGVASSTASPPASTCG